jgi:hypothetical protein
MDPENNFCLSLHYKIEGLLFGFGFPASDARIQFLKQKPDPSLLKKTYNHEPHCTSAAHHYATQMCKSGKVFFCFDPVSHCEYAL